MEKAFKFRLYPNKQQIELINKTFGCVRFVYNYYLAKREEEYKTKGITFNYNKCSADLTKLKQTNTWLKEADKFALQNSLKDLDKAFKNFLKAEQIIQSLSQRNVNIKAIEQHLQITTLKLKETKSNYPN
uniref:helix-turn-helix domain-containing protein n=1 Tax=Caloramator sp. Dgby_cultured_2 TaxID=3029174 RepID=UPI0031585AD3